VKVGEWKFGTGVNISDVGAFYETTATNITLVVMTREVNFFYDHSSSPKLDPFRQSLFTSQLASSISLPLPLSLSLSPTHYQYRFPCLSFFSFHICRRFLSPKIYHFYYQDLHCSVNKFRYFHIEYVRMRVCLYLCICLMICFIHSGFSFLVKSFLLCIHFLSFFYTSINTFKFISKFKQNYNILL
jgi:hypothetical protein